MAKCHETFAASLSPLESILLLRNLSKVILWATTAFDIVLLDFVVRAQITGADVMRNSVVVRAHSDRNGCNWRIVVSITSPVL